MVLRVASYAVRSQSFFPTTTAQGSADTAAQKGPSITIDATRPMSRALISHRSLTRMRYRQSRQRSPAKTATPKTMRESVGALYQ
jgi:hypothetical protein